MAFTAGFADKTKLDFFNTIAGHTLKIALYLQASANFDLTSPVYSATGEVVGAGYSAGGQALTTVTVAQLGDTVYITCDDPTWPGASFTADSAIIYDASNSNHIVAFYTFASTTKTGSAFTLTANPSGVIQAV